MYNTIFLRVVNTSRDFLLPFKNIDKRKTKPHNRGMKRRMNAGLDRPASPATGGKESMGLTLAEKLIKAHLVSGDMTPGSEIGLKIDQTLTQDATGTMAYLEFEAMVCRG